MKKRLIYRLSSFGDLLLCLAALPRSAEYENHWVVAEEFAPIVSLHPNVHRIWPYSRRKGGLKEWVDLQAQLATIGFSEVVDLHASLRTRVAHWLWCFDALRSGKRLPRWRRLSKEKLRRAAYILFKSLWPTTCRPRNLRDKAHRLLVEGPDRRQAEVVAENTDKAKSTNAASRQIGIMPSSAWSGKGWRTSEWLAVCRWLASRDYVPVVLGTNRDSQSTILVQALVAEGVQHENFVGKMDFDGLAGKVREFRAVLAVDTGIAHLSAFFGVPTAVVYGPTRSDFGFGLPRGEGHLMLDAPVWCSPCSKDGRLCIRANRYVCMKKITAPLLIARMEIEWRL